MGVDDGYRRIGSDPFAVPHSEREPARLLRSRLAAPVSVWTAYDVDGTAVGITVSSVLVAEGDPPQVIGLIGPLSEFWEALSATERFVVHVVASHQVRTADQFALRYPGDPFAGLEVTRSEWGPVLAGVTTRAKCTLATHITAGYSLLVTGRVDEVLDGDDDTPLVHYRGRYLTTRPRLP